MAIDAFKNFAKVLVSTGYDASATSIVLASGEGTKLPTAPFNVVWWNSGAYADPSDDPNREIVRVTTVSTDTLTVTRAQEGTAATTKNTGNTYKMIAGITADTMNSDVMSNYTALSFNNRQLGASGTVQPGQSSLWLAPFRLQAPVNASSILAAMVSYSGTITSAATAQHGQTLQFAIWSQHSTDPNRFDTMWSTTRGITFWNSGTSSYSFDYGGTTSSSAGSNIGTASVMGIRQHVFNIGSTFNPGIYIYGSLMISSTAGYSAAMSRYAAVVDNPLPLGMGTFNQATNASIGYVDGGVFTAQTAAIPATISINAIKQTNNSVPFFKMGAV